MESDPAPIRPAGERRGARLDEGAWIEWCVRSLHASNYPQLKIVVVDDGSTDNTAQIVHELALPDVRVISQSNAGKPNALSMGIRNAKRDVLVLVDGDTIFEADSVRELVAPLANPSIGAVSGNTKAGNRTGVIGRWHPSSSLPGARSGATIAW